MNNEEIKELYPASESERKSLLDWYKDHSNVELHDDGINTLCKICPPEKYGEYDDCEALQNIMRVMFYRIAELESKLTLRDENIDNLVKRHEECLADLKRKDEALRGCRYLIQYDLLQCGIDISGILTIYSGTLLHVKLQQQLKEAEQAIKPKTDE